MQAALLLLCLTPGLGPFPLSPKPHPLLSPAQTNKQTNNAQLGALAEFRQDWGGAVASYQAACAALGSVPLGKDPAAPCAQRHAEVCAVAEVVHTKALMLLLHQQRTGEAIAQLRRHLAAFGSLPCAWLA